MIHNVSQEPYNKFTKNGLLTHTNINTIMYNLYTQKINKNQIHVNPTDYHALEITKTQELIIEHKNPKSI